MIYELLIFDITGKNIFQKIYGNINIERKFLDRFIKELITFISNIDQSERISCVNLERIKFVYCVFKDIISVLCTDQNEDEKYLNDKLGKVKEEYIKIFKSPPKRDTKKTKPKTQKNPQKAFEKKVDKILLPYLKMVIIGDSGVGKSSLLKLIMDEKTSSSYVPTVGADVKEFNTMVKNMKLIFWDFSGQPRFRKLWKSFLEGTDIAIIVTDSTSENLEETKMIFQLIKDEKPELEFILIANKQDLPEAIPPKTIEKYMGIKAHGLVAIDPNYRKKILKIIKKTISDITETKSKPPVLIDIKI